MKKIRILIVMCSIMILGGVVSNGAVFAKSVSNWSDETVQKIYFTDFYSCYTSGAIRQDVDTSEYADVNRLKNNLFRHYHLPYSRGLSHPHSGLILLKTVSMHFP